MTQTSFLGDKPVNRIGFGAMQLAGPGVFGPPRDPDAARAVLRRAIELGVDHIDTSQYYGPDVVNDLIRETLHPYPEDLKLVTKVGARRDAQGAWLPALSAGRAARRASRTTCARCGSSAWTSSTCALLDDGAGPSVPLAEQLGELEDLREEGKLDLIGVSNVTVEQAEQALELVDVGEVQNAYSILDRERGAAPRAVPRARGRRSCRSSRSDRRSPAARRSSPRTPAIAAVAERHGATAEPDRARLAAGPLRPDRCSSPGRARSRTSRRTWRRATSSSTPTTWRGSTRCSRPVNASPDRR